MLRPHISSYRVKKGDSLWKIAESQYGDPRQWPAICKANHLPNANLLLVGMRLHLPVLPEPHGHGAGLRGSAPRAPTPTPQAPSRGPGVRAASPRASVAAQDRASQDAMTPARSLQFPALTYELGDLPSIVASSPEFEISLSFTGEVTLQKKGAVTEADFKTANVYTFNKEGNVTASTKTEYDSKLAELAGDVKIRPDMRARTVQVSCGFAVAGKVAGQVLSTSEVEYTPPNRFKFTYKPQPIRGEYKGFAFEGEIGYEVEIRARTPDAGRRVPIDAAASNRAVTWIVVGGLVVAGAAIIVADGLKDVGTAGVGAVETPVSWALAVSLFARAGAMLH